MVGRINPDLKTIRETELNENRGASLVWENPYSFHFNCASNKILTFEILRDLPSTALLRDAQPSGP
jgi:hypothetical protein